ncbi:hypothetical protein M422DRAFT_241334 [Sphaerobolus stellatus SS14]|nr:hypothetical protein M422DRAFT_241334 [Sphaerobolus stellatus SS14]
MAFTIENIVSSVRLSDVVISPDGLKVVYRAASTKTDEPSTEEQRKESDKDDAIVWGNTKLNSKLRLYSLAAETVRTIVDRDNVIFFTWSPDSKSIAFSTSSRPELNASEGKTSLYTVSVLTGSGAPSLKHILDNDYSPIDNAVWPFDDCLYAVQPYNPQFAVDAHSIHAHTLNSSSGGSYKGKVFYGGETEDAPVVISIEPES